jgi:hypothetical protein
MGKKLTRRAYLTRKALMNVSEHLGVFSVTEAVATTLSAHPEWDPEEKRTWFEWESSTSEG